MTDPEILEMKKFKLLWTSERIERVKKPQYLLPSVIWPLEEMLYKIHTITDQAGKRSGLGIALYPGQHCFQAFSKMYEIFKKKTLNVSA